MQTFRPFRSTIVRQQKYYSERNTNKSPRISIFDLPREIVGKNKILLLNPEEIPKAKQVKRENLFIQELQDNLRKTAFNHSKQVKNQKGLHRASKSMVQTNYPKQMEKTTLKQNSEINKNINLSFETLNILYRTIIETKVRQKFKQKFELNAKKLPIIDKSQYRISKKSFSQMKFLEATSQFQKQTNENQNNIPFQKHQLKKSYVGETQKKTNNFRFINLKNERINKPYFQVKNEIVPWGHQHQLEYEEFY